MMMEKCIRKLFLNKFKPLNYTIKKLVNNGKKTWIKKKISTNCLKLKNPNLSVKYNRFRRENY